MSRNAARNYQEGMPSLEHRAFSDRAEDPREIRRRQLAEVLSHQGQIELDIDLESLSELRAAR
jgi:hypothetical protein